MKFKKNILKVALSLTIFILLFSEKVYANSIIFPISNNLKNNISYTILDSKTGTILSQYKSNKPVLVASNMKLVTTFFALEKLSSHFKWQTSLYYLGKIDANGTLNGNIYIKGGGDPTFSSDELQELLAQLKNTGIKNINGNIIIDESIFNSTTTYSMLKPEKFDSDTIMPHGFMVDGDAVKFNLDVNTNEVLLNSNLNKEYVSNQLKVNAKPQICNDLYHRINVTKKQNKIILTGQISPQCHDKELKYKIYNHIDFISLMLSQALDNLNIDYNDISYENTATGIPHAAILVTKHDSEPIEKVIETMNHFSVNLIAESLLLSVGAYTTNNSNTYFNAQKLYIEFMHEHNLQNKAFKLENGAGLSRHEFLTTNSLATMLLEVYHSPYKDDVLQSLPAPGSKGTLEDKFMDFKDRLLVKTGTLNDVKSYAGYFMAKPHHEYVVVFTINRLTQNSSKFIQFDKYVADSLHRLEYKYKVSAY